MFVNNLNTARALAVEKDADLLQLYQLAAKRAGIDKFTGLTSGRAALEAFDAHEVPDLLIIDLLLPEMDGLSLLTHLEEKQVRRPPTIVIACPQSIARSRTWLDAMPDVDVLAKPFDLRALVELMVRRCREERCVLPITESIQLGEARHFSISDLSPMTGGSSRSQEARPSLSAPHGAKWSWPLGASSPRSPILWRPDVAYPV